MNLLYNKGECILKILKNLTVQVVLGIVLGIAVGYFFPAFGTELKVLADWFIKLIKMKENLTMESWR